jgi:hypothetical protein
MNIHDYKLLNLCQRSYIHRLSQTIKFLWASCVQVLDDYKKRFLEPEKIVLADLLEFIKVHDPDVISFPYANMWFQASYSQKDKKARPEAYPKPPGQVQADGRLII